MNEQASWKLNWKHADQERCSKNMNTNIVVAGNKQKTHKHLLHRHLKKAF
jgi:hypothetical protein